MKHNELELFLDESGDFISRLGGKSGKDKDTGSRPGSQLAGLLVPRGQLTVASAADVLQRCHDSAGLPYSDGQEVHGKEIPQGDSFDTLTAALSQECLSRGWQPVRLTNKERVHYGDRVANYTNLLAELVVRVCEKLQSKGAETISIGVVAARVVLVDEATGQRLYGRDGTPAIMPEEEYLRRLREYLAAAAVRKGWADRASAWTIQEFQLGSGLRDPRLQLCDLVSHGSYGNFRKLGRQSRQILKDALAPYDWTLSVRPLLDRIHDAIDQGHHGLAARFVVERLAEADQGGTLRDDLLAHLKTINSALASVSPRARTSHLMQLLSWPESVVAQQRDSVVGLRVARALEKHIADPLQSYLSAGDKASVEWFGYGLLRWELTAQNHLGGAAFAHGLLSRMDSLAPQLAGRWEHSQLLIDGLTVQAVTLTDRFEHAQAAERMRLVAAYYADLSGLFHVALPGVFPEIVRSDARAKALGTMLQAEMFACLMDGRDLSHLREVSDTAIGEFSTESDQRRQFQYRCQLETLCGDFSAACQFLAQALGLSERRHSAIAESILQLPEHAQGFPLHHWLRLGAALIRARQAEAEEFLAAFTGSRMAGSPWCRGVMSQYPAHGVLRQFAAIEALRAREDQAIAALSALRRLLPPTKDASPTLILAFLASVAEVASHLLPRSRSQALRLLDHQDPERMGLVPLVRLWASRLRGTLPTCSDMLNTWDQRLATARTRGDDELQTALIGCARQVGY